MAFGFQSDLIVKELDNEFKELKAALVFEAKDGTVFTVPCGFVTDYASIPWIIRWRFPKSGPWKWAATVHDYLYQRNGVTRARADDILREGMEAKGVPWRTRQEFWLGVRAGGWVPWNKYRAADKLGR